MKKIMIWFVKLTKRQLKKPSVYFIMAALFISCLTLKYIADNYSVMVEIGIVNEDDGSAAMQIEKALYGQRGMVKFRKYSDRQSLKYDVENETVLGGYVIREGFSANLISGDYDKTIESFMTPNSLISGMANEVFFSYVMEELAYEELVKDTVDTGYFTSVNEEDMRKGLREYYQENITNGSTFSVKYENDVNDEDYNKISVDMYDYITPVIGKIVGLFVFMAGLCGAFNYYNDRENGTFSLFRISTSQIIALVDIAIPVVLISAVGMAALVVTGMECFGKLLLIKYIGYALIVIVYCYILKTIIRKKAVFVSLIPVLMIMSLVFCPVFVNIGSFAKGVEIIGRMLPLYYL